MVERHKGLIIDAKPIVFGGGGMSGSLECGPVFEREYVLASDYDALAAELAIYQERGNALYEARIEQLERVVRSIALATEKGALYESIAIHNAANEALTPAQREVGK